MLGPIISAGASLAGGLINSSNNRQAQRDSAAAAQQNIKLQKTFAQEGLTWKIDDAFKNADRVHPIYSLGASTPTFSPVSQSFTADNAIGNAIGAAGQDIGRAVNATATQSQRVTAFTAAAQKLALEKGALENEVLKQQLASQAGRLRQVSAPPSPIGGDQYMIPGQSESGSLTKPKPLEVTPGVPSQPQTEGGAITDHGYARTSTGWAPVPSKDVKERIEDNFVQERLWDMRNNLLPSFGYNMNPPPFEPPPGKEWHFHIPSQEYRLLDTSIGRNIVKRGFTTRYEGRNGNASSGW